MTAVAEPVGRVVVPPALVRHAGLVAILVALAVFAATRSDVFLTTPNLLNVLRQVAIVAVLAAGLTVLMTAGGIDFSLGSSAAVVHGVVATLLAGGAPAWVAVLAGLALGAGIGLFNGLVIVLTGVAPFVVTLGSATVLGGAALLAIDGRTVTIGGKLAALGSGEVLGVPTLLVIAVVVLAALGLAMRYTAFGRDAFAIGGNEEAARLSGIPVARTKILLYAGNGLLAGLAGVMLLARMGAASPGSGGLPLELTVVAAVVIGGTALSGGRGTMVGTALGVLLVGVVNNTLNLIQVNPFFQDIAVGAVLLVAAVANQARRRP